MNDPLKVDPASNIPDFGSGMNDYLFSVETLAGSGIRNLLPSESLETEVASDPECEECEEALANCEANLASCQNTLANLNTEKKTLEIEIEILEGIVNQTGTWSYKNIYDGGYGSRVCEGVRVETEGIITLDGWNSKRSRWEFTKTITFWAEGPRPPYCGRKIAMGMKRVRDGITVGFSDDSGTFTISRSLANNEVWKVFWKNDHVNDSENVFGYVRLPRNGTEPTYYPINTSFSTYD